MTTTAQNEPPPTNDEIIEQLTQMQKDYDVAMANYERAAGKAKVLKKAAEEQAKEMHVLIRKLGETMPLYEPYEGPLHRQSAAENAAKRLPKPV